MVFRAGQSRARSPEVGNVASEDVVVELASVELTSVELASVELANVEVLEVFIVVLDVDANVDADDLAGIRRRSNFHLFNTRNPKCKCVPASHCSFPYSCAYSNSNSS